MVSDGMQAARAPRRQRPDWRTPRACFDASRSCSGGTCGGSRTAKAARQPLNSWTAPTRADPRVGARSARRQLHAVPQADYDRRPTIWCFARIGFATRRLPSYPARVVKADGGSRAGALSRSACVPGRADDGHRGRSASGVGAGPPGQPARRRSAEILRRRPQPTSSPSRWARLQDVGSGRALSRLLRRPASRRRASACDCAEIIPAEWSRLPPSVTGTSATSIHRPGPPERRDRDDQRVHGRRARSDRLVPRPGCGSTGRTSAYYAPLAGSALRRRPV